ncbi:OmpW/AlkL family protein [Sediminicola luteus]|uniref:OmpW family protein n=1 Tax=Sediminicola luteus TaxID=319238 RepID=A0A2A4G7S6_9FLAO|nr:OmpW family outer membrane protein [Sediminicola luteus]PCE64014.1 OmpW family protein [Sediminicola luteus]
MRTRIIGTFIALFAVVATLKAQDAEKSTDDFNRWQARFRLISVIPNESADIGVIGGDVEISTAFVPELDFTYFFTPNIAAELILGTTKHDVNTTNSSLVAIGGAPSANVDLGSVWLLPPTLTLQYHFATEGLRPYVGAGVNYTIFYGVDEGDTVADVDYDNSLGFALQGGIDYDLNDKWFLNLDVKYLWLNTDVTVDASNLSPLPELQQVLGAIPAEVDINPLIVGLGVGMKF